jgi:DNA-binding SARP family transcriptional activator
MPTLGRATRVRLSLLGGFVLTAGGETLSPPLNGQRVLAFLALKGRSLHRAYVAGSLWIDSSDERAAGSLRSALWRLNRSDRLVEASGESLTLAPHVDVDVEAAVAQAHELLDPSTSACPALADVTFFGDLLPDWYDDWVVFERERFRQLRAHALECLCERLSHAGRFGEAIEAGLAAARIEPLRESAQRALIRVHVAEGNIVEAVAQYRRFREHLRDELGLAPSAQLEELVARFT